MAFYEILFPVNISYGAKGGPGFLTRIVSTSAGFEYRSGQWVQQRGSWMLSHGIKQPTDVATLLSFFYAVGGRGNGWRFQDWNDYTDGGVGNIATNPSTGNLQLNKLYTAPAALVGSTPTFTRWIQKPVPGTVSFTGGGTLDYTTGVVSGGTVNSTWTGQFHVPCRFDVDRIDLQIEQPVGSDIGSVASSWPDIPIVEILTASA